MDRSGGQRRQRGDGPIAQSIESLGITRIDGQRADHFAIHDQGAAHAGVDAGTGVRVGQHQTVVGIWQRAVRSEAHRRRAAVSGAVVDDDAKAGVLAGQEATAGQFGHQAAERERHQGIALKAQEGRGLTRDDSLDGGDQPSIAIAGS